MCIYTHSKVYISCTPQYGRITYIRKPVPPSIPFPGRSFGYEEDESGELKPQQIPRRDTSLGPAYYDVTMVSSYS